MTKFAHLGHLRQYMNDSQILEELIDALSTDKALDCLKYIARMWDIEEMQ